MIRSFYLCLLLLHPPAFRRRFGREMLWIFDETAASGAFGLLADSLLSLTRQWILRSGGWKIAAALASGLTATLGGIAILGAIHSTFANIPAQIGDARVISAWNTFSLFGATGTVVALVIVLTVCSRKLSASSRSLSTKRIRHASWRSSN